MWKANLCHLVIIIAHMTVRLFSNELRITINSGIVGKYLQAWGK